VPATVSAGVSRIGSDPSVLQFQAAVESSFTTIECPPGLPLSTSCFRFTGQTVVPGLGASVAFSYRLLVDRSDPQRACTAWSIPDGTLSSSKGTLSFSGASQGCQPFPEGAGGVVQWRLEGGTGAFAGATGSGTASFPAGTSPPVSIQWSGTLTVAGYTFDTTAPAFSAVATKRVGIRHGRGAHVRYTVTAQDAVDGSLPGTCIPPSGYFFLLGKTPVTCSATDSSGNSATTRFLVIVTRRR
jgi:hypothetical protein